MTTTTATITAAAHVSTCHFASVLPYSRASSLTVRPIRGTFSSRVRCSSGVPNQFSEMEHKEKLDPLEAYIPAVILTELQIKELGQYLEVDQPKFADCRNLLRSGPASSLRINIRAVAQYASDAGNGKSAFNEVDQCLRALEELDSLLLRASRNDSGTSIESMKVKVVTALNALNSLLRTVPAEVLDKGKAMADAYMTPGEDLAPENIDPQLKQLESIL
ncbi:hypothetical protein DH2020_025543 [Rehmannia glutinosa]|uniref:DUF7880 domain-containing protein n=1 Tax=Rehmannia glutinosa TaxID=99300 RepID=A0ABR0W3B1_REHGL